MTIYLHGVSSLAAKPAGIIIWLHFHLSSISPPPLPTFLFLPCFPSGSVLNSAGAVPDLTDPTRPPPSPTLALRRGGGPLTCLLLRHRCQSGEGPCCVSEQAGSLGEVSAGEVRPRW